jgi:2-polyprenyl-3-methyl-5-hydroxy-6-metoxy-1,4-benzoquinol methylase
MLERSSVRQRWRLYGIECSDLIDYDQFTIPFDGTFDLIVANHMLTHLVRLDRFFNELRAHLRPGGHLYVYRIRDFRLWPRSTDASGLCRRDVTRAGRLRELLRDSGFRARSETACSALLH